MSNIATIVGDPHLKNSNIEIMTKLVDKVEKLGHPVIWLGDMLDTKEVIRGKCLNFWFDYFSMSGLHHTILVGNHDWFNLQCEDHSLKTLSKFKHVKVIDRYEHTPGQCAFIPYVHEEQELKKIITQLKKDHVKIVFGHLEIKDFDYGNGRLCEEGLTLKSFSKFKKVVSGHFHKYQEKENLVYLGTPFSHSFGEANQEKFIAVMDLNTSDMTLIPTELPRHISIDVDCSKQLESIDARHNIDHVRLVLHGTQEEILRFPKDQFENTKFIERPSDDGLINVDIEDTATNEEQFTKWAKDIKGLDPETVQLGLDIMGGLK